MKYIDCQTFAYFCGLSKFMEMLKAHILVSQAAGKACVHNIFLSYLESTRLSTRSYLCKPCQKFKVEKLNKFMNWLRAGQGVCLRCVGCCTGWQKRLHCVCYHHVLSKVHCVCFCYHHATCLSIEIHFLK